MSKLLNFNEFFDAFDDVLKSELQYDIVGELTKLGFKPFSETDSRMYSGAGNHAMILHVDEMSFVFSFDVVTNEKILELYINNGVDELEGGVLQWTGDKVDSATKLIKPIIQTYQTLKPYIKNFKMFKIFLQDTFE